MSKSFLNPPATFGGPRSIHVSNYEIQSKWRPIKGLRHGESTSKGPLPYNGKYEARIALEKDVRNTLLTLIAANDWTGLNTFLKGLPSAQKNFVKGDFLKTTHLSENVCSEIVAGLSLRKGWSDNEDNILQLIGTNDLNGLVTLIDNLSKYKNSFIKKDLKCIINSISNSSFTDEEQKIILDKIKKICPKILTQ